MLPPLRSLPRQRGWFWLLAAACLPVPALLVRLDVLALPLTARTVLFGLAIVGAAFVLTWASEAAERDISQSLALAFLALVAVLPEYAVDMYFAWTAGHHPEYAAYAAANMTGGNRLLVGLGWPVVVGVFWLTSRHSLLSLAQHHALELSFLLVATVYSFTIPLKGSLAPYDGGVLIGLFVVYLWLAARNPREEVDLIGPAARLGALPRRQRRVLLVGLFLYAAAIIVLSAEAFASGLVDTGTALGIDRFLLVQWVAPLASEAPEFIAAVLLAARGRAGAGLGVLVSSKVNQWTLLVGGLPLAYSAARGGPASLPLDARQVEELLLTAAQSVLAVAVLASLSISLKEALLLLALFVGQLLVQDATVRYAITGVYLVLALVVLWRQRKEVYALWRWWRTGRQREGQPAATPS